MEIGCVLETISAALVDSLKCITWCTGVPIIFNTTSSSTTPNLTPSARALLTLVCYHRLLYWITSSYKAFFFFSCSAVTLLVPLKRKAYINSDKHKKYNGYSWVNNTYSQQCVCQHRHHIGHRSIYSPQHKSTPAKFLCCTSPWICIGQAEKYAVCTSICIYPGLHGYYSTFLNVQPNQSTAYV